MPISMDQVRSLPDFQTAYQWSLSIPNPPTGMDWAPVELRCISTTTPNRSVDPMEVTIRGHRVRQAGMATYAGDITLTFVETVDATVLEFFNAWQDLVWQTETGIQAPRAEYMTTVILTMLDGRGNPTQKYTLFDVYPNGPIDAGELSGETGDVVRPSVTLSYTYYRWEKAA